MSLQWNSMDGLSANWLGSMLPWLRKQTAVQDFKQLEVHVMQFNGLKRIVYADQSEDLKKKNRWEPINFRQSRLRRDEIHQWYIIWNLDADVTVLIQISIIPIYEFCKALDARITSRCHRGDYCVKNALSRIICSISAGNGPSITTWQKMFDVQVTSCLGTKTN
jgi:hypothetical protein